MSSSSLPPITITIAVTILTMQSNQQDIAPTLRSIKDAADFSATIAKGPVVVDFMAPWCGKCKMIGPYVEELKSSYPGVVSMMRLDRP